MFDIVEYWPLVESDFQREYHIDLTDCVMSYRRFITLLSGLSGESVFFNKVHQERKNKPIEGADNIAANMAAKMNRKRK